MLWILERIVPFETDHLNTHSLSDSFTILGLWVLGLAVSHISKSVCKLMSPELYFYDKSAILLHPGTG